uniref:Fe2OG dioxygenase domain-containing protein n=1 Tax=Ananas comosus var. bracteatus TaxID=296719 RepID=A0A6V7PS35_ANACO|nr:unnamed protein product [Ananas comosus var. bracteatus]
MSTETAAAAGVGSGGATAIPAAAPALYARDAMIAWFRGEFAAANAIIDALCGHLAEIGGGGGGASGYEAVFAAIHRRRANWIPVLHMQRYFSVAEIAEELRRVAASPDAAPAAAAEEEEEMKGSPKEEVEVEVVEGEEEERDGGVNGVRVSVTDEAEEEDSSGDSSDRKGFEEENGAEEGSQEHTSSEYVQICSNHDDCLARPDRMKILKGFVAKESVKGHMVNVVKGLKVYQDIFMDSELLRLAEYINELRLAGRRGELSGETFIFFNKQMKGNKREIIQLGVPLFQPTNEEATSNIEPVPLVLQAVIDHLVQWRLIPESRKPNCCIINFFDEDEHSQPYFKPPHLDNPISMLLLSETRLTFGRALVSDHNGNYKGPLTLSLKEGSLLVMRGNSADTARHVVCPSSNRRVSITFVKVRSASNHQHDSSAISSPTKAVTLWQPEEAPSGTVIGYGPHALIPSSMGFTLQSPYMMLAPARPMIMSPNKRMVRGGTGVFLPWGVGPKKYAKHLPPRIQKRRFASLPPPLEARG